MSDKIFPYSFFVDRSKRNAQKGHTSFVVWLTGLSGAGKSTLADEIEQYLSKNRVHTFILDGDFLRHGLNKDLSFSDEDRAENIRRVGEVTNLFIEAGIVVIAAFVSPFEADRNQVKELVGEQNYVEIFVDTSVETCEKRDKKGLYQKARNGEIMLPGVSSTYEKPTAPDFVITPENMEGSLKRIYEALNEKLKLK